MCGREASGPEGLAGWAGSHSHWEQDALSGKSSLRFTQIHVAGPILQRGLAWHGIKKIQNGISDRTLGLWDTLLPLLLTVMCLLGFC